MMPQVRKLIVLSVILVAALRMVCAAQANVTLPAIIGDHMVVQADKKGHVWGWADPGESVTVIFAGQSQSAKAGRDGAWQVTLSPVQATAKSLSMTVEGNNTLTIKDILIGQVWLCSGQSNMEFPLKRTDNAKRAVLEATNQQIRLFHTPRAIAATPANPGTQSYSPPYRLWDIHMKGGQGQWVVCNPEDAAKFSGVGYFFGQELQRKLNQPIGMIESAWGGTPAEAWTSAPVLATLPRLHAYLEAARQEEARDPKVVEVKYHKALAAWKKKLAQAKAQHKKPPRQPRKPYMPGHNPNAPAVLFNGMIHPLIPFTIQGVIWYQGVNNGSRAYQYRTLLPAMIRDWRSRWGQGDFPFGIVQLPNDGPVQPAPVVRSAWPVIRESQLLIAQKTPNVGLTVNIDLGSAKTIHPTDKIDVGQRLALWALAKVYGKDIVYSGPIYSDKKIDGNKVRLTFRHVDGGLIAKGHDGKLVGFAVAGADKVFHSAAAMIDGKTVVVHADAVPQPVAVRYAWAPNPVCNLYNKAGLPASPFRTDDWHVSTQPE